MGRRKIEIKAIKDNRNRSVTFLKRKGGLLKKAHELSVLCSVDVAVIIFGNNKKLYKYSSSDIGDILTRYQYYEGANEHKGPADFILKGKAGDNNDDDNGSGSLHHRSVEPQMMPPQFQSQHAFQYFRNRTPSASPQIPNGVLQSHPNPSDLLTHVQGQLMQGPPQSVLQAGPQYPNSRPLHQQQLYADEQGRALMPPAFPQHERPQGRLKSSSLKPQQIPQQSQHELGQQQSVRQQMLEPVRRMSMKPRIFSPFDKSHYWASNVKASHSDTPSSSSSQSVVAVLKVQIPEDGGTTTSESNYSPRSTNEPAVPPLPSLSATTLLSADATGPLNPFARPQHQVSQPSQNSTNNVKYFTGSPVSPLPSRFMTNEFVPSPSIFYPEWIIGNREGNTLNFATPVVGTGPNFLGDDISERGGNGDWRENTKRKPQEVDNREGKHFKRAKHKS